MLLAKGFGPKLELKSGYAEVIRLATSREGGGGERFGRGARRRNAALEGEAA